MSHSSLLCHESPADVASWDVSARRGPVSRQAAVEWILRVSEFYGFRPETAFLAVNYLDCFLASDAVPGQSWEVGERSTQLLSVACVSVAAKMEETCVPSLTDLQVLGPRFVFGPKAVTRMELLLMSALKWQMRFTTPFDLVDRFGDMITPELYPAGSRTGLISRATKLIAKTCYVKEFREYGPSEIAASAIICAAKESAHASERDPTHLLRCFDGLVDERNVRRCMELMEATQINAGPPPSCDEKSLMDPTALRSSIRGVGDAACRRCEGQNFPAAVATSSFDDAAPDGEFDDLLCNESMSMMEDEEDENL